MTEHTSQAPVLLSGVHAGLLLLLLVALATLLLSVLITEEPDPEEPATTWTAANSIDARPGRR